MSKINSYLIKYYKLSLLIFVITGISKLILSMQEDRFLSVAHPLFSPLTNRQVFSIVGFIELIIAALIAVESKYILKSLFILWISSVFIIYRLTMHYIGFKGPCGCLGNLKDILNVSDYISLALLIYLFAGSSISLYIIKKSSDRNVNNNMVNI
ncbi:MAG: MauE/DoxX family redox-associated membrane protein [Verrucomicrobiia bacterium]